MIQVRLYVRFGYEVKWPAISIACGWSIGYQLAIVVQISRRIMHLNLMQNQLLEYFQQAYEEDGGQDFPVNQQQIIDTMTPMTIHCKLESLCVSIAEIPILYIWFSACMLSLLFTGSQ